MNQITLERHSGSELFGTCPQVGDKVYARITGTISEISAELIDVGNGQTLPGQTYVTVLVQEVVPS